MVVVGPCTLQEVIVGFLFFLAAWANWCGMGPVFVKFAERGEPIVKEFYSAMTMVNLEFAKRPFVPCPVNLIPGVALPLCAVLDVRF